MERMIKIPSVEANLCEVEFFLNSIMREANIQRKVFCKIYLSVYEAVNNAFRHGNLLSEKKFVQINFEELESGYLFVVHDEGLGFDYSAVPDPLVKENLKKESGRGIFIMKNYSDEISFHDNGRCVNLFFKK